MLFPERLEPIRQFVTELGIGCRPGPVPEDSFLPGVALDRGELLYDPARLGSPGDLLHEAGHIALVPQRFRPRLDDDVDAVIASLVEGAPRGAPAHADAAPGEAPDTAADPGAPGGPAAPTAEERAMLAHTEVMAIAWSYAAARRLEVEPACVFWPGTYRMPPGQAPDRLVEQIELGFFVGIQWLARYGFCAAPPPFGNPMEPAPFPAMKKWLAD